MKQPYTTPQEAEDAYYDAIEAQDIETMMEVWDGSEEIICLLPMMPAQQGRQAVRAGWEAILQSDRPLEIEIHHLSWIERGEIAIHLVEERVKAAGQPEAQRVYASNTYCRGPEGWHLLMHQNAPTPPPPGLRMPEIG
jgi:ketosteroid isomerase-like protein